MPDHPPDDRYVVDTSAFLGEGIRRDGEDLSTALDAVFDLLSAARVDLDATAYVPRSVHDELTTILGRREIPPETLDRLDAWVERKRPARSEVSVPSSVVHAFVTDVSDRVDQGLRVSETAVRRVEAGDAPDQDGLSAGDRVVSELREDYRDALRSGVVDSGADLDVLILARELDAVVVAEDRGVRTWAEEFGLRCRRGEGFRDHLDRYLAASDAAPGPRPRAELETDD